MTDDRLDPYARLGVPRGATSAMIIAAYRNLARSNHPDIVHGPGAQHLMAELNSAYSILRNPVSRAAWDAAHPLDEHASHAISRPQVTTDRTPSDVRADASRNCTWMRGPDGVGAAGPPPGRPSGSVLMFGRHLCWSIGEIARVDPGYLRWLMDRPEGRPYRDEIEAVLEPMWRRVDGSGTRGAGAASPPPRGRFRRP